VSASATVRVKKSRFERNTEYKSRFERNTECKSETLGFVRLYWVELSVCIILLIIYVSINVPGLKEPYKSTCLGYIYVCFKG